MDLLSASYLLYGDCKQLGNGDITVKGKVLTSEQLELVTIKALELDIEYKSTQYQRDRKEEYDKLNQDELRFNDLVNNTTTWLDSINEIKAKYSKP